MKKLTLFGILALFGCATEPGVEKGPQGTIAYLVQINAEPPGTRIEVNGDDAGVVPLTYKIFGDRDGTFHNFGSQEFVVKAYPPRGSGGFVQTKVYHTGGWFGREDMVPKRIFFDTLLDTGTTKERIQIEQSK